MSEHDATFEFAETPTFEFPEDAVETPPQAPPLGPWPWYVHAAVCLAMTGAFNWLMLGLAFYQRERKQRGVFIGLAALAFFTGCGAAVRIVALPWYQALWILYACSFLMGLGAWLYQRMELPPPSPRFQGAGWRDRLAPFAMGMLLGACVGMMFMVLFTVHEFAHVFETSESMSRETIIHIVFAKWPYSLLFGLALGLWWAGEGERFSVAHVVAFFTAPFVIGVMWVALIMPINTMTTSGFEATLAAASEGALTPPWARGVYTPSFYNQFATLMGMTPLLLIGAPRRVRDMLKRCLLVTLGLFACHMSVYHTTIQWWELKQSKIMEEIYSPDEGARASAFADAQYLLKAYPDAMQWPKIALPTARYLYEQGAHESARALYEQLARRFEHNNRWRNFAREAKGILASPGFAKTAPAQRLDIPVPDTESYLSPNWMALLSVFRYWKGEATPDSEVKIALKRVSLSDEKILLQPMPGFVELDDAASNLDYDVTLFPSSLEGMKTLLDKGFPVICAFDAMMFVIHGYDEARSVLRSYHFGQVSPAFRAKSRGGFAELLGMVGEGEGESRKRLAELANQAYFEIPYSDFLPPSIDYLVPFVAVVSPPDKRVELEAAAKLSWRKLEARSRGYKGALMGLASLRFADPVQAFSWARGAARVLDDPLPNYVAALAYKAWKSRDTNAYTSIPLAQELPELADTDQFFAEPENATFLAASQDALKRDMTILPWVVEYQMSQFLEESVPEEAKALLRILHRRVEEFPSDADTWEEMADVYAEREDLAGYTRAQEGYVSAAPTDFTGKSALAYALTIQGQLERAAEVLAQTPASFAAMDADAVFCRAVAAEARGENQEALALFEQAIGERRYKPRYFIRYAQALLKDGKREQARKALAWALKTAPTAGLEQKARELLAQAGGAS